MGGRGTYAKGNQVPYTYKCVGYIEGVQVLDGIKEDGKQYKHSLPEESHSSKMYIKLDRSHNFYELREYDEDGYCIFEIGYHSERKIDSSGKRVLHAHDFPSKAFEHKPARTLTKEEFERYKKYLKGVKL